MKFRYVACFTMILLLTVKVFAWGDDAKLIIEALEGRMSIYYNGNPVRLEKPPLVVNGSTYLPLRVLADLFNKAIQWDARTNSIDMADRTDPLIGILKEEMVKKDLKVKELDEKIKLMEKQAAGQNMNIDDVEEEIREALGTHAGVSFLILLSGNENEVRVKLYTDLKEDQKAWNRLSSSEKLEYLQELGDAITTYYPEARIKGYAIDMKDSRRLMTFNSSPTGDMRFGTYKNYSTISTLEDMFNDEYRNYLADMCIGVKLLGNETNPVFEIHIPYEKYKAKWEATSDSRVKNLMGKITADIEAAFRECLITGYVYDTDGKVPLASCWKQPDDDLVFQREE